MSYARFNPCAPCCVCKFEPLENPADSGNFYEELVTNPSGYQFFLIFQSTSSFFDGTIPNTPKESQIFQGGFNTYMSAPAPLSLEFKENTGNSLIYRTSYINADKSFVNFSQNESEGENGQSIRFSSISSSIRYNKFSPFHYELIIPSGGKCHIKHTTTDSAYYLLSTQTGREISRKKDYDYYDDKDFTLFDYENISSGIVWNLLSTDFTTGNLCDNISIFNGVGNCKDLRVFRMKLKDDGIGSFSSCCDTRDAYIEFEVTGLSGCADHRFYKGADIQNIVNSRFRAYPYFYQTFNIGDLPNGLDRYQQHEEYRSLVFDSGNPTKYISNMNLSSPGSNLIYPSGMVIFWRIDNEITSDQLVGTRKGYNSYSIVAHFTENGFISDPNQKVIGFSNNPTIGNNTNWYDNICAASSAYISVKKYCDPYTNNYVCYQANNNLSRYSSGGFTGGKYRDINKTTPTINSYPCDYTYLNNSVIILKTTIDNDYITDEYNMFDTSYVLNYSHLNSSGDPIFIRDGREDGIKVTAETCWSTDFEYTLTRNHSAIVNNKKFVIDNIRIEHESIGVIQYQYKEEADIFLQINEREDTPCLLMSYLGWQNSAKLYRFDDFMNTTFRFTSDGIVNPGIDDCFTSDTGCGADKYNAWLLLMDGCELMNFYFDINISDPSLEITMDIFDDYVFNVIVGKFNGIELNRHDDNIPRFFSGTFQFYLNGYLNNSLACADDLDSFSSSLISPHSEFFGDGTECPGKYTADNIVHVTQSAGNFIHYFHPSTPSNIDTSKSSLAFYMNGSQTAYINTNYPFLCSGETSGSGVFEVTPMRFTATTVIDNSSWITDSKLNVDLYHVGGDDREEPYCYLNIKLVCGDQDGPCIINNWRVNIQEL